MSQTDKPHSAAERIAAEAIAWVERADREDWSAEDESALGEWRALSPAHAVAHLRASDGWRRADRLAALRGSLDAPNRSAVAKGRSFRPHVAAAGIVAMTLIALWVALPSNRQQPEIYSTNVGGHKVLALADGSQIELNTDTVLHTEMDAHRRLVRIDRGEAYFQVKHDATRPFVVLVGGHKVTDLGTKFVVRQRPGEIQVTLVEGRAEVDSLSKPGSQLAILTPGDVAVATADAISVVRRSQRNVANDLSWRRGVLIFDRTTLADAAAQLNRYNQQKVVVGDADAAQERIEGTFPANNVELFGRVARSVLGLHVEKQGNDIVISR